MKYRNFLPNAFWGGRSLTAFATKKVTKFFDKLDAGEQKKVKKILWFLDQPDTYLGANEEQTKRLLTYRGITVWELKPFKIRIAFFREGQVFYLVYGFKKTAKPWSKEHINNLKKAMDHVLNS